MPFEPTTGCFSRAPKVSREKYERGLQNFMDPFIFEEKKQGQQEQLTLYKKPCADGEFYLKRWLPTSCKHWESDHFA